MSSQDYESYVPVYDVIPEKWEDARFMLVEYLKKITNSLNVKEIGWFLDEQLLSGKAFIPTTPGQFRSVFRQVYSIGPIVAGANVFNHNIDTTGNFSLVQLFGAATNAAPFRAIPLPNGADTITMGSTQITVTTALAYDICYVVVEFLLEA